MQFKVTLYFWCTLVKIRICKSVNQNTAPKATFWSHLFQKALTLFSFHEYYLIYEYFMNKDEHCPYHLH